MFEAKPILGWGYDNFNVYDRRFQRPVLDLVNTEKDHSSHNIYLTLLAEQGLVGFLLFLAPLVYWLIHSARAFFVLPAGGLNGRNFLISLWLVVMTLFIVNNFAPMWVAYGLGLWWVLLGFVANLTYKIQPQRNAGEMTWAVQTIARRGRRERAGR
jgi:O-antigen ligase